MTRLYQQLYDSTCGYLVYRCGSDHNPTDRLAWARIHKVAVFVTEEDASGYCDYRNHLVSLYGTDRVPTDLWRDA